MRYLLLIYEDQSRYGALSEEQLNAEFQLWNEYTETLGAANKGGEALQPVTTATSVQERNGDAIVSDGPFAETKEQLGGYYLLDVANLDEALELAKRCPAVKWGTIELRPVMEFDQA